MFQTPESVWGGETSRTIHIPSGFRAAVNGALLELMVVGNWEARGDVTPAQAAALMEEMYYDYLQSGDVLIGSCHPYACDTLPDGVLDCDGQQYDRVDYPKLYEALASVYIVDADHFVTPDYRGRVIVGAGTGGGLSARVVGDSGGVESHQLTVNELPSHDHSTHQHGVDLDVEGPAGVPQPVTGYAFASTTGLQGGNQSHPNMQPFSVAKWGIIAR